MRTAPSGAASRHSPQSTHSSRFSSTMRSAAVVLLAEDVDRADLGELGRQLGVRGNRVVDVDVDEQRVGPHAVVRSASFAFTRSGISAISSATVIPASARRAIFSRRRVLLALDDRAGVAEGHARHLVHEPAGHEGDDREARVVARATHFAELRLHAAAGLGVDHDRLGLLVGLEQRHQLGVGGADDRVAADRHGGRLAEAGGAQGRGDLGRHPAGARDHADRAGGVGLGRRPWPGRRCRPS